MPVQPRIALIGARKFQRDINAAIPGSKKVTTDAIRAAIQPIAADARSNAPKLSGELAGSIRGLASGANARISSRLPYASVHEYGGSIAPNGGTIRIRRSGYVDRAITENSPTVERELRRAFDQFARTYGFTGGILS